MVWPIMRWFWLSYTQHGKFRCVVLVRAEDFLDACAISRMRGLAPGRVKLDGVEIMGWVLPEDFKPVRGLAWKRLGREKVMQVFGSGVVDLDKFDEPERLKAAGVVGVGSEVRHGDDARTDA